MKVEYTHNNSGGSDWLTPDDWKALHDNGWEVRNFGDDWEPGLRAYSATKEFPSLGIGIAEWEYLTNESSSALGCSCCGVPHSFSAYDDDGKWVDSYSPSYPYYGEEYAV